MHVLIDVSNLISIVSRIFLLFPEFSALLYFLLGTISDDVML